MYQEWFKDFEEATKQENSMSEELIDEYKNILYSIRDKKINLNDELNRENIFRILWRFLDLYNKEKEKNKELQEYSNWHIEHLTEDIADYIDDDRKANASLIGELKEEREHWKDIIRISNNEKTYIDYKNY